MKRVEKLFLAFSILGSVIIFILLAPMVLILFMTNPIQIGETLIDPEILEALLTTITAATIATISALIFGTPLAYIFARKEFAFKNLLESLLNVPLAIPHSVAGILILLAYHSGSSIGGILSKLGLVIEDSFWGIVIVMLFVSAPIFISSARSGFSMVNETFEHVARTLGAGHFKTFFTITLPLAFRSILSGAIVTWARAVSEVGALLIVAPYPKSIALLVIERFESFGLSAAIPITALLLSVGIIVVLTLNYVLKR
ncbi:MAG: molybdenum ABC transporter permease [Thaumarchaeota archaeon]|nr:MAG: molybdenum ABC transporter permease [Nitrososphaerota archaeon]